MSGSATLAKGGCWLHRSIIYTRYIQLSPIPPPSRIQRRGALLQSTFLGSAPPSQSEHETSGSVSSRTQANAPSAQFNSQLGEASATSVAWLVWGGPGMGDEPGAPTGTRAPARPTRNTSTYVYTRLHTLLYGATRKPGSTMARHTDTCYERCGCAHTTPHYISLHLITEYTCSLLCWNPGPPARKKGVASQGIFTTAEM